MNQKETIGKKNSGRLLAIHPFFTLWIKITFKGLSQLKSVISVYIDLTNDCVLLVTIIGVLTFTWEEFAWQEFRHVL